MVNIIKNNDFSDFLKGLIVNVPSIFCVTSSKKTKDNILKAEDTICNPDSSDETIGQTACMPCYPCLPDTDNNHSYEEDLECYPECHPCGPCDPCSPDERDDPCWPKCTPCSPVDQCEPDTR